MAIDYTATPVPANGQPRSATALAAILNNIKTTYNGEAVTKNLAGVAGINAASMAMLPATTGIHMQQPGDASNPLFLDGYASDGVTRRFALDYAGNLFATSFTGVLGSLAAGIIVRQIPGTSQNYNGAPYAAASSIDVAVGTAGAPITALGPLAKFSATHGILASQYGGNSAVTEGSATLSAYAQNAAAATAQDAAIYAIARTDSTTAGGDTVGVATAGISSATATTGGIGLYSEGRRYNAAGYAMGAEVRAQNESGTDSSYNPAGGVAFTMGLWVTSGGTGNKMNGYGLGFGPVGGSQFIGGVVATAGSMRDYFLDDASSAGTSYRIGGAHTHGIDTTTATLSGGALRLGWQQKVRSKNSIGGDVTLLALDINDHAAFFDGKAGFDSTGACFLDGGITTYVGGVTPVPLTNSAGLLQIGAVGDGTITSPKHAPAFVTAQSVPDWTVQIAAINAFSPTTGAPIVRAAQASGSFAALVPATGGQSVYVAVSLDANLLPVLTPGTAATTPTRPALPSNNRGLAYVLVPNGATAITAGMISEFRDLYVPFNPNAAGGAPAGLSYLTLNDETGAGLASATRIATLLNGGTTMGDPMAQTKPVATDASLKDLMAGRYVDAFLPQDLSLSGSPRKNFVISTSVTPAHSVYFNGRQRAIVAGSTTDISALALASGAYRVYADLNTAGASTWVPAVRAIGAGPANSNQTAIADFYWDAAGGLLYGDGTAVPNTAVLGTATGAQVRPRIVNQSLISSWAVVSVANPAPVIPSANFAPVAFGASGGAAYWFTGQLTLAVTGGAADSNALVQIDLNGAVATGPFMLKLVKATANDEIVVPIQVALASNTLNAISFRLSGSVGTGSTTNYTVGGAWLTGQITGGVT